MTGSDKLINPRKQRSRRSSRLASVIYNRQKLNDRYDLVCLIKVQDLCMIQQNLGDISVSKPTHGTSDAR